MHWKSTKSEMSIENEGGRALRHPVVVCCVQVIILFLFYSFFLLKMLLPWDITDIISSRISWISWCRPPISSLWPKNGGMRGGGLYPAVEEKVWCSC
jgi:hypothetical protein